MSKRSPRSVGRDDILAAALREFAAHGFDGASTVRIAAAAGVTQPLVHHHFGSKQGLWNAVTTELFAGLDLALGRTMQEVEGADSRTRLAHLLRTLMHFIGQHPEVSRLTLFESSAGGAPFEELYNRWGKPLIALCRREIRGAVADGTFREVDAELGYLLVVGACVRPFAEPRSMQAKLGRDMRDEKVIARYADLAVEVLLRGLANASPAKRRRATPAPRRRRASEQQASVPDDRDRPPTA